MDRPDIFMPLYIGDYLAGTSRLTTELHGAYMLLIMDYWMNGAPPNDDSVLASITRMTPDAWSIAQASLKHFFYVENGCLKHKRIEEELAKASEKKRSAKEKAEKAANARWKNATSNAPSIGQALLEECPSPSPSPSLKELNTLVTFPSDEADESEKQIPEKQKNCPIQKIIDLYHETLPELPRMLVISEQRKTLIAARWKQSASMQSLERWKSFFEYVRKSDFLMGRTEKPFFADLEFLTTASKFAKVVEGKYHAK